MRRHARVLWVIALVLFAGAPEAWAGKVKFRPYVDIQTEYEDNIFLEGQGPDANQSDFSLVVTPGASVEWPVWDLFLQAFYQVGFGIYLDFNTNDYMTHTLGALARYTPMERLSLGVADTLEISALPEAGNETFTYNKVQGQAKYEWITGLGTSLSAHTSMYQDPSPAAYGDFDETGYGIGQTYDITSKITVGLTYDFTTREFPNLSTKDYDEHTVRLPSRFSVLRNTSFVLTPGYCMRSYQGGDSTSPMVATRIEVKPVNHELSLGYDYDMVDTFEELQAEEFEGLSTAFTSEKTYSELRTYATEYSHVLRHKFSANWIWHFLKATSLITEGTYQMNEYDTEIQILSSTMAEREDNILIGSVGVQQKFTKWLLVILKYTHLRRDSNIAEEDYSSNRIGIEVMGTF